MTVIALVGAATWFTLGVHAWDRSVKRYYKGGHAEFWQRVRDNGTPDEAGPLFGAATPLIPILAGPIALVVDELTLLFAKPKD